MLLLLPILSMFSKVDLEVQLMICWSCKYGWAGHRKGLGIRGLVLQYGCAHEANLWGHPPDAWHCPGSRDKQQSRGQNDCLRFWIISAHLYCLDKTPEAMALINNRNLLTQFWGWEVHSQGSVSDGDTFLPTVTSGCPYVAEEMVGQRVSCSPPAFLRVPNHSQGQSPLS